MSKEKSTEGEVSSVPQKFKTVTVVTINPIDPGMWKYAEQEVAAFYERLKENPSSAFTHIFANLKVEVKTVQIEV